MDGLTPEQQALFASIMGNSSQSQALSPKIPQPAPTQTFSFGGAAAPAAPAADSGNSSRVLSQAEIDALIASMGS